MGDFSKPVTEYLEMIYIARNLLQFHPLHVEKQNAMEKRLTRFRADLKQAGIREAGHCFKFEGENGYYQFISSGAGRYSSNLPPGILESDVQMISLGPVQYEYLDRLKTLSAEIRRAYPNSEIAVASAEILRSVERCYSQKHGVEICSNFLDASKDVTESAAETGNQLSGFQSFLQRETDKALSQYLNLELDGMSAAGFLLLREIGLAIESSPKFEGPDNYQRINNYYKFFFYMMAGRLSAGSDLDMYGLAYMVLNKVLSEGFFVEIMGLAEKLESESDDLIEAASRVTDLEAYNGELYRARPYALASLVAYSRLVSHGISHEMDAQLLDACKRQATVIEEKCVHIMDSMRNATRNADMGMIIEHTVLIQKLLSEGNEAGAREKLADLVGQMLFYPLCWRDIILTEAWKNNGIALLGAEKYEDALASFDKALEIHERDIYGLNLKAVALANLGRHTDALAMLDISLQINADHPDTQELRNHILKIVGQVS